jgi:hypothetical protein
VLTILVERGAIEGGGSLRLLPLGLVARAINCNNELWMAAAVSHPDVMGLTPPQLAGFVGALQCTDLLKRPMSIWSSFQVRGGAAVAWRAGVWLVCWCVRCGPHTHTHRPHTYCPHRASFKPPTQPNASTLHNNTTQHTTQ